MRLLIIGALEGQLSEATKMAMNGGAKVAHAPSVEIALAALRAAAEDRQPPAPAPGEIEDMSA